MERDEGALLFVGSFQSSQLCFENIWEMIPYVRDKLKMTL